MAYELRDRQRNKAYIEISPSDSEEESDGVHDDPEPQLVTVHVVDTNMNAAAESATRRRPGRPPRNAAPARQPSQGTLTMLYKKLNIR